MNDFVAAYFPRIHTALAEWVICIAFIIPLKPREMKPRQVLFASAFLVSMLLTFYLMEKTNAQGMLWVVLMALGMLQMLLLLYAKSRGNWPKALYRWARAFLMAELAASLEWQFNFYLHKIGLVTTMHQTYYCMWGVYVSFFIAILLYRRKTKDLFSGRVSMREALSAVSIALGAFTISNIQFAFIGSFPSISSNDGVLYARTMVDLGGAMMLYANSEQRRQMYLRYEFDAMTNLLQRQYEQYQQLEANSEAMRRVYHDLKHQIAYLESEQDFDKREALLKEMKEIVRIRESKINTGNSVLDTILTGKSLLCADEGIVMTCYADAKLISFMDVMDVCSIFGNLVDNAIEHERTISAPENRLIKIYVSKRNAFLLIKVENMCESPVVFEGGNPVTTKADKQLHGLGLKNVRRSVEKYGGHIHLEQVDSWFTVTILVPLPADGGREEQ